MRRVVCRFCRRPLVDPLWRARRVGRGCARKRGLRGLRRHPLVLAWRPVVPGDGQLALFEVDLSYIWSDCDERGR